MALVNGVHQLDQLLHRGRLGVEDGQGRVDPPEAQRGIGAAEAPHAGVGGRGGVDGQQHQDPAAEIPQNEVELGDEVAEGPGGRDHGVARGVEQADALCAGLRQRQLAGLVRAELTHEGVVDDVGAAGLRGEHVHGRVGPGRPDGRGFALFQEIALGLEMADFAQRQTHLVALGVDAPHGRVEPVPTQRGFLGVDGADDLRPGHRGASDVGADPGAALHRPAQHQCEGDGVAAEKELAAARRGVLDQIIGMNHSTSGGGEGGSDQGRPRALAFSSKTRTQKNIPSAYRKFL